jgi:dTDP-4-amino-4,6-dideoxygalactose transaminase
LFVIRSKRRDELQKHLKSAGVEALVHYPVPPHLQEAYREMNLGPGSLPVSETIHREALSLPMGPQLSDEDVICVIEAVQSFVAQNSDN